MRSRNFYFPNNSSETILRRQNKRRTSNVVELELRTIVEVAPMVDNRTMEELLQAPMEGYGEAIVIPKINADHFEIKMNLLQLVQANPYGFERENPHTHINNFKRITSTLKFKDVSNDVINLMIEDYAQEILGFSNNSLDGNPTLTSEPIISDSSPSLTPFEGSDFILEEIEAYLKDETILPEIDHADCDQEGDIYLIEKLLNNDLFQLSSMDLKQREVIKAKSLIEEPPELELKDLPSPLEYAYLEGADKLPVVIAKDLKVDEKEALLKLPHPTIVKGVRSFLGHADFYRRFIQDFSKIARPMTHLLEKETSFVFSKDCIDAFKTLKKKLTEAPILVVPDWNLHFELMCDASDFAIGAVLGQRPFPSPRGNRYILVAVDYLSKLVEAKALPTNDALIVVKFLKSLFARFGTPRAIISDRGTHFCNDKFAKVMSKYGVTHRLATTYHPQTSRQVEVSNRGLKRILKGRLEKTMPHGEWSSCEALLWRRRTTVGSPGSPNFPHGQMNAGIESSYVTRLKIFLGKLKSRWSGPFTISEIYPYETAKLIHPDGCNFKVNCHHLKHYHGGDPPPLEIPDVHTFAKDN
nr:reverse transcriptase domain-containing protein [Tanacetum cinerariifolium]